MFFCPTDTCHIDTINSLSIQSKLPLILWDLQHQKTKQLSSGCSRPKHALNRMADPSSTTSDHMFCLTHSINSIHRPSVWNDKHFKKEQAMLLSSHTSVFNSKRDWLCTLYTVWNEQNALPNRQRETLCSPEEVHEENLFCVNTHTVELRHHLCIRSELNTHEIVYMSLQFNVMCYRCAVCMCASYRNTLQKGYILYGWQISRKLTTLAYILSLCM